MKLTLFRKQPWLITPEALQSMAASALAFADTHPPLEHKNARPLLSVEDGVGVISINGPMLRRPDLFSVLVFGATDTEEIADAVREAVGRQGVQAILLDIDSPGGTVNGTPELAQAVADASRKKSIYAFTSGQMCSAAYWVASQCDAIYASPSARVGSIGVILPVMDSTEAFRKEGIRIEVFAAGKFKSAGTPGTSLSDEQREWLQSDVDEIAADFKAAVLARGRKIPDAAMEGQTFSARNAQRLNLAGVIKDRAAALTRLRSLHVRTVDTTPGAMSTSIQEKLSAANKRIEQLESDVADREDALLSEATSKTDELRGTLAEAVSKTDALRETLGTLTPGEPDEPADPDPAEARAGDAPDESLDDPAPTEDVRLIEAAAQADAIRQSLDQASVQADEIRAILDLLNAEDGEEDEDSGEPVELPDDAPASRRVALRPRVLAKRTRIKAREQAIAKLAAVEAARIVAETGTSAPAEVTPRGDSQTEGLLERFNAITDPKEQTVFWRNLTPQQKAFILNAK